LFNWIKRLFARFIPYQLDNIKINPLKSGLKTIFKIFEPENQHFNKFL